VLLTFSLLVVVVAAEVTQPEAQRVVVLVLEEF
jgi:hypothetical protein